MSNPTPSCAGCPGKMKMSMATMRNFRNISVSSQNHVSTLYAPKMVPMRSAASLRGPEQYQFAPTISVRPNHVNSPQQCELNLFYPGSTPCEVRFHSSQGAALALVYIVLALVAISCHQLLSIGKSPFAHILRGRVPLERRNGDNFRGKQPEDEHLELLASLRV